MRTPQVPNDLHSSSLGIACPSVCSHAVELIRTGDKQVLILVDAWMPLVRDAIESRAVKKTLTIPKWLDDMAIEQGINFSRTLQEALKHQLDIPHERR